MLSFRVPRELAADVQRALESDKASLSELMRDLLRKWLAAPALRGKP